MYTTPPPPHRQGLISTVFHGFFLLVEPGHLPKHGSDASDACFFRLPSLPETLAFDHLDVIAAVYPIATSALRAAHLAPSLSGGERERIAGIIERDALVADNATRGIG